MPISPPARRNRNVQVGHARLVYHTRRLGREGGREGVVLGVVDGGELAESDEAGGGDGEEEGVVVVVGRGAWCGGGLLKGRI